MRSSSILAQVMAAVALLASPAAWAYRPFDQTDAEVAPHREVEIELGPVALQRSHDELVLVAPALIVNYGVWPRIELVLEGKNERSLRASTDKRWKPQDLAVSLKGLVRRGSVQGEDGPSIAIEPGVLVPGRDQPGTGVQMGVIVSALGPVGAVHVNLVPGLSRAHAGFGLAGVIVEGPNHWRVRPVGEGSVYGELGSARRVYTGLCGLIARAGEDLALDAAVRLERAADVTLWEARAGLTYAFGL
jgi:hypothetical protein